MKKQVVEILQFFRIADEHGRLSLTNLVVIASIVNIMLRPEMDLESVGVFLATIIGYQVKRFAKITPQTDELKVVQDAMSKMDKDLQAMKIANGIKRGRS